MYASRMFHSFGIVQSNTAVPVGISSYLQLDLLPESLKCLPHAVSSDAATNGIEITNALVKLGRDFAQVHGGTCTCQVRLCGSVILSSRLFPDCTVATSC